MWLEWICLKARQLAIRPQSPHVRICKHGTIKKIKALITTVWLDHVPRLVFLNLKRTNGFQISSRYLSRFMAASDFRFTAVHWFDPRRATSRTTWFPRTCSEPRHANPIISDALYSIVQLRLLASLHWAGILLRVWPLRTRWNSSVLAGAAWRINTTT